jgi:predicted transposase/invertase (TIGR01784 family)
MEAYSSSISEMNKYALFTDYARIEGKIEGKIEVVLNAVSKGLSIKDIAEITNFSQEQILEILSERY